MFCKTTSISQNKHRLNVLHNELTHKEMPAVGAVGHREEQNTAHRIFCHLSRNKTNKYLFSTNKIVQNKNNQSHTRPFRVHHAKNA